MEPTETKNRGSQKVPPMMGTHPQRERADQGAGPLADPLVQDIAGRRRQRASVGKISAKCCSFSAVSAPIFARKYAFCSIFQNLPDSQAEIFEI